jgi:hypothetical protein
LTVVLYTYLPVYLQGNQLGNRVDENAQKAGHGIASVGEKIGNALGLNKH